MRTFTIDDFLVSSPNAELIPFLTANISDLRARTTIDFTGPNNAAINWKLSMKRCICMKWATLT